MQKVTKAVIIAAGRGTRFLPFSKACPKEMIPVIDKPSIQLVVEEIVESGITDILIIDSAEKIAIENHFKKDLALEGFLAERHKDKELDLIKKLSSLARFTYVKQCKATGSADAVLLSEKFADGQPIAVLNGDDAMFTKGTQAVTKQLINCYDKYQKTVVGVQPVMAEAISKYGAINIVKDNLDRSYNIDCIIEKPKLEDAPSLFASLGRYVISADFYDYIRRTPIAKNGEHQFTDALLLQAKETGIMAYDFLGLRYDLGDKLGYVKATVEYALRDNQLGEDFKNYLKVLIKTL